MVIYAGAGALSIDGNSNTRASQQNREESDRTVGSNY